MPSSERRKYPRVAEAVACQIAVGPSVFTTQTRNLSCGGVLCQLSRFIPTMTKLKVILELPVLSEEMPGQTIRCDGVVVRQETLPPPSRRSSSARYLTAIYFSELKRQDRRRIAEFVLKSMLSHGRRRS